MSDTHAQSVAFVRDTMLPEQPPPVTEAGAIKWVRENLFRGWFNTILTIVSLYIIFKIVTKAYPWFANRIWNTSSLAECREMLDGMTGACFSVLTERWNQLLFGFQYPPEAYWRPTLAFVLLFVAVAPVLFVALPRKLLIFTGLYPFIAFWLIWGGTLLVPLVALIGLGAGYVVFLRFETKGFATAALTGLVAVVLVWWLGGYVSTAASETLALE